MAKTILGWLRDTWFLILFVGSAIGYGFKNYNKVEAASALALRDSVKIERLTRLDKEMYKTINSMATTLYTLYCFETCQSRDINSVELRKCLQDKLGGKAQDGNGN